MKSLLTSCMAVVIGACLFTSCTTTEKSTAGTTADTGDKNVAPRVGDTGPRQDQ